MVLRLDEKRGRSDGESNTGTVVLMRSDEQ